MTTQRGRVTIQGAPTHVKATNNPSSDYSIMDYLKETPTLISILELLKLSSSHKEILEKALVEMLVPNNLDTNQFQSMVGNITSTHHLFFYEKYLPQKYFHNQALYLELGVQKH